MATTQDFKRTIAPAHIKPIPKGKRKQVPDHLACDGCNGSGIFRGGGVVVNGVYKGYQGTCYRCQGKGYQTPKDRRRNRYYDNHVRTIHA